MLQGRRARVDEVLTAALYVVRRSAQRAAPIDQATDAGGAGMSRRHRPARGRALTWMLGPPAVRGRRSARGHR